MIDLWAPLWYFIALATHVLQSIPLYLLSAIKIHRKGFRTLHGVTKTLFSKLWWRFRVSTDPLWNKYCKKQHPVIARARGVSHV